MKSRYKLIKDLPFQMADDMKWKIEEQADGDYWFYPSNEDVLGKVGFTWRASWGDPSSSGFFEEVKLEKWKPELGDQYWYISYEGLVCDDVRKEHEMFYSGNCFKSEEDAELALDKYVRPAFDAAHEELGY